MEGKWVVSHMKRPLYPGESSPSYLYNMLKNNKNLTFYVLNLAMQSAAKSVVTVSVIGE